MLQNEASRKIAGIFGGKPSENGGKPWAGNPVKM